MGQKVNPYGFRLGVTTDWKSRWFEERNYQDFVIEDWKIRDYLMSQLESAAVSRIHIERTRDRVRVELQPSQEEARGHHRPSEPDPAQHPGDQAARARCRPHRPEHRGPADQAG